MKTNVLVVDDDDHMRIALKESLSKIGYTVSLADNGLKAVEEIDRNMFDLVITDVKMPHLSGIDLLQRVKDKAIFFLSYFITAYGTVRCCKGHQGRCF